MATTNVSVPDVGKLNVKVHEQPQAVRPQAPTPTSVGKDAMHADAAVTTSHSVAGPNGGDPVTKRQWSDPVDWQVEVS